MSITNELREWMRTVLTSDDSAWGIADRIDTEHEMDLVKQYSSLTTDMTLMADESMAEHGWMRLPVDADGEPIHIGDVMEVKFEPKRKPFTVSFVGERAVAFWVDGQPDLKSFNLDNVLVIHHHKPTVEDVLRDMHGELYEATRVRWASECTIGEYNERVKAILAEYAEKLREVVEHERD